MRRGKATMSGLHGTALPAVAAEPSPGRKYHRAGPGRNLLRSCRSHPLGPCPFAHCRRAMPNPSPFRHKALAALLAFLMGGLGVERLYLGMKRWWVPLAVSAPMIPLLIGVANWYQTPPFFILMAPVIAGFIHALVIALMPDEKFDARFNATSTRRNRSGWNAVLVAIATLMVGTTVLMITLVLLFQTWFEYAAGQIR